MDELKAIADMLDEPPTRTAEDEGRRRLRREIANPSGGRGRTRARFGWPLKTGLGLVAAGAAAAVAVSVLGPGAAPPAPGGTQAAPVDLGKQAVLAAAENAAKQRTGKYFYIHHTSGQSYVVPARTGAYALVGARSEMFVVTGLEPGMKVTYYGREPAPRLWTAADEAAYAKAGSPAKVEVWSGDKALTFDMTEQAKWDLSGTGPIKDQLGEFTIEELQNLPADPEALAERFFDDEELVNEMFGGRGGKDVPARFKTPEFAAATKIRAVGWRLGGLPIPPKVRAALMKALMAEPGVRAVGETTDPLGRKGVALTSGDRTVEVTGEFGTPPERQGTYTSRQEIVFDRATGNVLAMQNVLTKPGGPYKDREPGFIIDFEAVPEMGWSDGRPTPPRKVPGS
ncbi:hypothetical protein [Actinomadura sediminis]|uniref:CU044_5270 family protein n=1 Tax=Actinomadura sediminis TaxID=1038904 RepID=A0ABW3ET57_9ACTN